MIELNEDQRSPLVNEIRPLVFRLRTVTRWRSNPFSARRLLFDLNGETRTTSKNESSAVMVPIYVIPSAQNAGLSFRCTHYWSRFNSMTHAEWKAAYSLATRP